MQHSARSKRSQDGALCGTEEASCCLSRIAVNLTDLGWDHVISPSVIQYTFCQGHCNPATLPAGLFMSQIAQIRYVSTWTTKHDQPVVFLQKLHSRGTYSLPAPCCYPRNLKPVQMMYVDGFEEDGSPIVRVGVFENMLATSCGCS